VRGASSAGAFVGLYSSNCAEWLLCEHAAFSQSMVRALASPCHMAMRFPQYGLQSCRRDRRKTAARESISHPKVRPIRYQQITVNHCTPGARVWQVTVPLYDTLGHDSVAYICNHGELAAVCCSVAVLPTLLSQLHRCPSVQLVVVFPNVGIPMGSDPLPAVPSGSSARLVTLDQVCPPPGPFRKPHPRYLLPHTPSTRSRGCPRTVQRRTA
jgi:hypothetical protein